MPKVTMTARSKRKAKSVGLDLKRQLRKELAAIQLAVPGQQSEIQAALDKQYGPGKEKVGGLICFLPSGEPVFNSDPGHEHVGLDIVKIALKVITSAGKDFIKTVVEFSKSIGEDNCVATKPGDDIYYAVRPGRETPSRMVRNRVGTPSSKLVVILMRVGPGYVLCTAFPSGIVAPREIACIRKDMNNPELKDKLPELQKDIEAAARFWAAHALVK